MQKIEDSSFGVVAISDADYPRRVAHELFPKSISELVKLFGKDIAGKYTKDVFLDVPALHKYLAQYQSPEEVDKITAILKDVKEVKEIVLKNIDQLLIRGEKLEELAKKSSDLSAASKEFMTRSKQLNRCCTIL